LRKLGFWSPQRLVVVFWENEIGAIMCYDGVIYKKAQDQCAFVSLCCRDEVASLLKKHRVKVGWSSRTNVTHWLVIDQEADKAFFARAGAAYDLVSPQKPIFELRQQRLPFPED
jgi:hypothetical protein